MSDIQTLWFLGGLFAVCILAFACGFFVLRTLHLQMRDLLWRDMFEASCFGMVCFDKHGHMINVNSQACSFFPFLVLYDENTAPKTLNDFFDYLYENAVEYDDSTRGVIEKASSDSDHVEFREIIKTVHGFCLVELYKTRSGQTVLLARAVNALIQGEREFKRLNEHSFELMEVIKAVNTGLVIFQSKPPHHSIVFANEAFCRYVERDETEVFGEPFKVMTHQVFDEASKAVIEDALAEPKISDLNIRTASKEATRFFNLKLTPIINRAGEHMLFVGVFTDTTALKAHENESSKAKKLEALGQLAAGVAHDFNNILSIIDGYSRLAARDLEDEVEKIHFEKISNASARGADLTKQMLTFSRNKIVGDEVIDLAEVLSEQEVLLRPLVDASMFFSVDVGSIKECFVECPSDAITQIVMNLTVNARDAVEDGGIIEVKLRRPQKKDLPKALRGGDHMPKAGYACISVEDNGTGMSQELQDKIFDPFFTTKEQGKGTGLGLSMVYGLVKQVGGHIELRSSLGKGSVFSVYFPISEKRPKEKAISGTLDDLESLDLKGHTVLVAEDEPDLLMLVAGMLEKHGVEVLAAKDGNEALLKQEEYQGEIDLLLTDVVMPGLNGVKLGELFQELRPDTKVLFMSGYPATGELVDMGLEDESCFMAKPIKYETLCRQIFEMLSNQNDPKALKSSMDMLPRWTQSSSDSIN